MIVPASEIQAILQQFNPWWSNTPQRDLPDWERTALAEIWRWVEDRRSRRALLLVGARQTGKTTLFRQAIRRLIDEGYPPANILYATLDHPLLKLAGLERTLEAWQSTIAQVPGTPSMLFLDEIQYAPDWQTWLKHKVDFAPETRVALTGSATPLAGSGAESGVGRWETIPLATLSFGEYLKLRKVELPPGLELPSSLRAYFDWDVARFSRQTPALQALTPHFHEYLLRGGFPEPAQVDDLSRCQRLLREDIVEKVLKRDMTALYGVRRVLELERLFLYLCYHDGGILEPNNVTKELEGVSRVSLMRFLDLFETTHLVYRLKPFGYGKEVLRGRDKVYLADGAIPGAVLLLGRRLLEQPLRLGAAVETCFFKHLFTRYYSTQPRFSYWRAKGKRQLEVDIVAESGDRLVPFEIKYQDAELGGSKLKGLLTFQAERQVEFGYAISKRWQDFGIYPGKEVSAGLTPKVLKIPASLACLTLS